MKQQNYFRMLMNGMVMACIALATMIVLASMPTFPQPEGTFSWSRTEHQLDETNIEVKPDGIIEVSYDKLEKPFYRALFKSGEEFAFQLGVDMDQDRIIDFTILDYDSDHYIDFNMILCHENCEETIRSALLLFSGKLILEKGI